MNRPSPFPDSRASGIRRRLDTAPVAIVADDDPMVLRVITRAVQGAGYLVTAVPDGAALVAAVQDVIARDGSAPELVVTDIDMPALDGLSALAQLGDALAQSRVIVVSASATDAHRARATALGAHAFLEKPFRYELLRALAIELRQAG